MEPKDFQEWKLESGGSKMNFATQLDYASTQVWGGRQNAITPKLRVSHEDTQSIIEVFDILDFSLGSSALSMTPINSSMAWTKKTLQPTEKSKLPSVDFITLDHIDINGKKLSFAEPFVASISFSDNCYSCRNEELDVVTMSPKLEDCIKDFEEEILFIWNEYGKEADSKLTKDAKELKKRILSHIKQ
ncbi:MAG: hypothetical protein ABSC20_01970 [Candidatus Bathyarchaeia archaeon]|jgi:hypothetical protein